MSCAADIAAAASRGRAFFFASFVVALIGCAKSPPPAGTVLVDETVVLARAGLIDSAAREFVAPAGSTVVAFADEQGIDVSLTLIADSTRLQVEDSRRGESVEVAVLPAPASGKMRIELSGPAHMVQPGSVHLEIEAFTAENMRHPAIAQRLEAYRAWSAGTRTGRVASDIPARAALLSRAIEALDGESGDARLAAQVRAVRAGMLYEFEVDWREARDEARRASEAFAAPGVADALNAARARRLEAAALQEMAHSSQETPESKEASDREARRIYAELIADGSALDAVGRGRVFNDLGAMDIERQEWAKAEQNFSSAIALYRSAQFRMGEVQTSRNLAIMAAKRGDYATASRAFDTLVPNIDLATSDESRATLLINAAAANINVGETDLAIERLLRAKSMAEAAGRAPARTRALQSLGLAYWARGDVEQARTFFDQAFEAQKALADDIGMCAALRARGVLLRDAGDARGALEAHRASLKHAHGSILRLRAQVEIARDYAALADRARALAAIRTGMKDARDLHGHPALLEAQLTLAEILVMERARPAADTTEAVALAGDALKRAQSTSDLPTEITARRVLARVALERNARDEAVRELESAIEIVARYSRGSANPELQAASRASQQQLFREYLDVQMAQPAAEAAQRRALEVLENVRALNFLLARGSTGARDTAQLDALLGQLASRHVRLAELREGEEQDTRAIEAMQLEMATLRAQIDRERAAQAASGTPASAAGTMHARWKPLARGQVQLSYSLGATRGYLWRRTAAGIEGWTLPGTASEIRAAVLAAARIDRLQKPAAYDAALLALSDLLLPRGVADAGNVAIVADDELSLVPFAALRSPIDPARRFAETHVIAMVPSLLDTQDSNESTTRRWRLVAVRGAESNEAIGSTLRGSALFPALPGAGAEVDAVIAHFGGERQRVRVLEGDRATVEGVRALMADGTEVMHFATHGLADLRHPLASLLALPHGLLTAGQIQEWRGNVGLVFLSACETAVGPTRFAEGMPGLQRAFLRAGAGNVIATLWPVEDRLAKEFAEAFYDELAAGVSPAEALARTQRRWVSSAGTESAQKGSRRRVAAWGYVLYSR